MSFLFLHRLQYIITKYKFPLWMEVFSTCFMQIYSSETLIQKKLIFPIFAKKNISVRLKIRISIHATFLGQKYFRVDHISFCYKYLKNIMTYLDSPSWVPLCASWPSPTMAQLEIKVTSESKCTFSSCSSFIIHM